MVVTDRGQDRRPWRRANPWLENSDEGDWLCDDWSKTLVECPPIRRLVIVPTLCVVMHPVTLCVTFQKRNAERPWRHSHAEREERSSTAAAPLSFPRSAW